jgi:hypothetical protein
MPLARRVRAKESDATPALPIGVEHTRRDASRSTRRAKLCGNIESVSDGASVMETDVRYSEPSSRAVEREKLASAEQWA